MNQLGSQNVQATRITMCRSIVSALVVASSLGAIAADRTLSLSKAEVLNAIAAFRADPVSDLGRLGGAIVAAYVKTSPNVMVILTPKVLPIFGAKGLSDDERTILYEAYCVGNAGSQLKRGQIGNDSYAGDLQLIQTYKSLQRRNAKLRVAEVEKLIELDRAGRLKQYVSSP